MNKVIKNAFINSSLTTLYIIFVSSFMFYGQEVKIGRNYTILIPITLLLLFVFSAAITGFLIFGKPALLYLDGKKKEALTLLSYSLGFLFLFTIAAIIALLIYST